MKRIARELRQIENCDKLLKTGYAKDFGAKKALKIARRRAAKKLKYLFAFYKHLEKF